MGNNVNIEPSSFRDPSGFVYKKNNQVYRRVNLTYKSNYDYLVSSGLYQSLVDKDLLLPHVEDDINDFEEIPKFYKRLKVEKVEFITYPNEWSFNQLKHSALLTLNILEESLDRGMILKDASSYNVQFKESKPVFIDSLSFEIYNPGDSWKAYKQFCEHFLAPLLLMSKVDINTNIYFGCNVEGIPLAIASKMLPKRTWLNPFILTHIHLHARYQAKYQDSGKLVNEAKQKYSIKKTQLINLIKSLRSLIETLKPNNKKTEWGSYYLDNNNYNSDARKNKENILRNFVSLIDKKYDLILDLGANNGYFSRILSPYFGKILSVDIDLNAVDKNYLLCKKNNEKNILPLYHNLMNPTPSYGWANVERASFYERFKPDVIMALALIHHIAISNNVPLSKIAKFFSKHSKYLIIEFVDKKDSQIQKLLLSREDIFAEYSEENFEAFFKVYFDLIQKTRIENSERTLYLFKTKLLEE